MKSNHTQACLIAAIALLVAGCGDNDARSTSPMTPTSTSSPQPTPSPTTPPMPLNSDLGAARNGGGCYPTAAELSSALDMLTLVNPEWAPVVNGTGTDSLPVFVEGTILGGHGDNGGDFPSTHVRSDQNTFVEVDPQYQSLVAAGNDNVGDIKELAFEWEVGAYPDWAWGHSGDRIAGMGRWIFDCGHPATRNGHCSVTASRGCALDQDCRTPNCTECAGNETCVDVHFGYSSELHPPYATAVMRRGRGAVLDDRSGRAVPATRTDIYVHEFGGAAADACVVSHLPNPLGLLNKECFPLTQPLARKYLNHRDFNFQVPLPPRPAGGVPVWRVDEQPAAQGHPIAVRAAIDVVAKPDDPQPHLDVSVRMTQMTATGLPTGFAGTLFAGWDNDAKPLTHVRLTVTAAVIHNPLQLKKPVVPRQCTVGNAQCTEDSDCPQSARCVGIGRVKQWRLQAAMNGEWRELSGLEDVDAGDVVPQSIVLDQYLPAEGQLEVLADGASEDCINKIFGQSLKRSRELLGFEGGLLCLTSAPHGAGSVRAVYTGPDFGSGNGRMEYETRASGGEGGACANTSEPCLVDADCAAGDRCSPTGGSFSLRYVIEKL